VYVHMDRQAEITMPPGAYRMGGDTHTRLMALFRGLPG